MSAGIDFHIHLYNLDTLKPVRVIAPEKLSLVDVNWEHSGLSDKKDTSDLNVRMMKDERKGVSEKKPIGE